jgi:hypothetical protein
MSSKTKCQLDEERKKEEDKKKKKEEENTREPYDKDRITFFFP